MCEPSDWQSEEIVLQIEAAGRRVESTVGATQQEAAASVDRARIGAGTL